LTEQQKSTRNWKAILTLLLLIPFGYYVFLNKSDFAVLLDVGTTNLVFLSILIILTSFFNAAQNAILIRSLGTPLSNLESFGLSNLSALVNIIIPQGLTITKAVYLKQRHAVPYSKFSALFLGLLVVFLFIGALLMALTNTVAALQGIEVPKILWLSSLIGVGSSLLFFFEIPKHRFGKLGKVGTLLASFSDGWSAIRSNRSCLLKACLWQLAIFISSGISLTMAYYSIGIKISPLLGISLAILISFSSLLSIIPNNLGIQEVVYGYLSYVSGLLFVQGVVISTLMRAVALLVTLAIAPLSWYFLLFRPGNKTHSPIQ
jgi:uncharacterized membrane protein YbhN (UPF0104 family)